MQKTIGIILIIVGTLMLAYQGIRYTTRENVVDIGSFHLQTEKKKTIPFPPIVGGVTLAVGIALLATKENRE